MNRQRVWGVVAVVLSAVGFGVMPIFARTAYADGTDVIALLFLRFLFGAVIMTGLMLAMRGTWPASKSVVVLFLMGGVGYVAQSFSFFTALQHASAGLVALLLYLYPILVAIVGAVVFGEPLGRKRLGMVLMAFTGTALTVWGALDGEPIGIVLGALSAVLYCAYILAGSRVLRNENPYACGAVVMISAAGVFGALVGLTGPSFPQTAVGWSSVVAIALVSTVMAMIGFFIGVRALGASDASTLSTLEPVVTIVAAMVFLNESLTMMQLVGGAVILVAVVLLTRMGASTAPRLPARPET